MHNTGSMGKKPWVSNQADPPLSRRKEQISFTFFYFLNPPPPPCNTQVSLQSLGRQPTSYPPPKGYRALGRWWLLRWDPEELKEVTIQLLIGLCPQVLEPPLRRTEGGNRPPSLIRDWESLADPHPFSFIFMKPSRSLIRVSGALGNRNYRWIFQFLIENMFIRCMGLKCARHLYEYVYTHACIHVWHCCTSVLENPNRLCHHSSKSDPLILLHCKALEP